MDQDIRISLTAGADLTSDQYKCVGIGGTVVGTDVLARGLVYNKPRSGEPLSILVQGIGKYRAGGAIAVGARLTAAASGWIATAASGDVSVGFATEAISSGSIGLGIFNFANVQV